MNALIKGVPTQKGFESIYKTAHKYKRKEDSSLQESSPGWTVGGLQASSGTALSKEHT